MNLRRCLVALVCLTSCTITSAQTKISDDKFQQILFTYAQPIPAHFGNTVQIHDWWEKVFLPVVAHELRMAPSRLNDVKATSIRMQLFNDPDTTCRFLSPAFASGKDVVVCPQVFNIYYGLMEAGALSAYATELGKDPAEFLEFASRYLYSALQPYVTSIVLGDRPRSVCNAVLLLYRFAENKSSEGCTQSAIALQPNKQSEFHDWWITQVRRRDLPEEKHITSWYGAVAPQYFTLMIFTLLHEVAHVKLHEARLAGGWHRDQELSADKYAFESLVQAGRSPAELLLLVMSGRGIATDIRKLIAPGISLPVGVNFPKESADLRELLQDKDVNEAFDRVFGRDLAKRFFQDILSQLPMQTKPR